MPAMANAPLFDELVREALSQPFTGWDFAFVSGRMNEVSTSWDYRGAVESAIASANTMLDLCTGGGEFLDGFSTLPETTIATESYVPNVDVAKARLQPRNVEVRYAETERVLPVESDRFDLVINRHGAFDASELARVSNPSGARFVTQQVGSTNAHGINDALGAASGTPTEWRLETACRYLEDQSFRIERAQEEHPRMWFSDIGALIYYLKAIPWQVPDFDVLKYRNPLTQIHDRIQSEGVFEVAAHRFFIEASIR